MALVSIYKSDSTLPWFVHFFRLGYPGVFIPFIFLARWGLVISILLAALSILFLGILYAMTGLAFIIQPFMQMVGGFLHPGKPMANMYFVLFSYSMLTGAPHCWWSTTEGWLLDSFMQASLLLRDLKIAQCELLSLCVAILFSTSSIDVKLPPRASFTAQILGTLIGASLNYGLYASPCYWCQFRMICVVVMNSIIKNQRDILLSIQGTNLWSGQGPQKYNSQAIAWGGLGHDLFASGKRYQWVAWAYLIGLFVPIPFWLIHRRWPKLKVNYLYTPIIWYVSISCFSWNHLKDWNVKYGWHCSYYVGWLSQGINSMILSYFSIALFSQWYLRTRYPRWFRKYNYILAAGQSEILLHFVMA